MRLPQRRRRCQVASARVTTRFTPVARLHSRLLRPVQRPVQRLVPNERFIGRSARLEHGRGGQARQRQTGWLAAKPVPQR
eukprot:11186625-Lingulodinium_polyedra.AAC.1